MARAELIFLNEREKDLIHKQSIETLEKIGVKVHSRSVLQLLKEHQVQPIEARLIRQGDEIIRSYEGKLAS
jgi:trimethylamine:corrinoid methyltransferase-like protein